ncbi:CGNR zinc finger domain-containing protein [Burkholderia plantarii]|uniref:CGNR zinc finger domain-containing protein n=1 Tax=Burkholderia plantarii TaxID=41899 RepID=UPI0018DCC2DD|nr:CGNR zinc finger domain-containing protein [Burkholderia plantarii]MBI0329127.1 CGNR zinc finger domain-containing protein [Burkholderia plantarii]
MQADKDVGGHLVLNFVNTCGGAGKDRDVERLVNWRDAIEWATANGVLNAADNRLIEKARLRAGHRPSDLLKDLTELREAAHSVFSAIAASVLPAQTARLRLEGYIVEAMSHSTLSVEGRTPAHWTVCPEKAGSTLIKDRLAITASELLSQPILSNVRECGACSWLFLDLSRSRSRRWCSMATCGNRAKAQRHYHTTKTTY